MLPRKGLKSMQGHCLQRNLGDFKSCESCAEPSTQRTGEGCPRSCNDLVVSDTPGPAVRIVAVGCCGRRVNAAKKLNAAKELFFSSRQTEVRTCRATAPPPSCSLTHWGPFVNAKVALGLSDQYLPIHQLTGLVGPSTVF